MGVENESPQGVPLWQADHFELKGTSAAGSGETSAPTPAPHNDLENLNARPCPPYAVRRANSLLLACLAGRTHFSSLNVCSSDPALCGPQGARPASRPAQTAFYASAPFLSLLLSRGWASHTYVCLESGYSSLANLSHD